jgi:serine/threonine protein kinase/Tol biopolymer transport system component
MTPDNWKRVEELFEAAQKLPGEQCAEFLRQACPDEEGLRAEVESLLKAADSGDGLLDGSPLSSLAEPAPALKAGDKLANFQIVALIGRGGMGEVYRARDLRLKREVAIKTLPPGFAGDRDRIARFEREARAASALNHPNIVSVFDVGTEGGVSFIVSELVEGETLARLIQGGPLPLRKLIEVSTQICDGLAAAHATGVIHRDLKPGNIMLTRDGRVKILDFGLARQDHTHGVDSTTMEASHPGVIMGTPGYMSPEQVRGEPTDARSDIFSLGVILYEMASGKRAFAGGSSIEVMNSILKDEPPELPPASPPALDRIVRRCIDKEPSRRFQGAADLGFALQSLSPSAKREERPKRLTWLKWAAMPVACVVAASVYWLGVRPRSTHVPSEFTFRRLTNNPGFTTNAAISSDGKLVAYVRNGDIWVQQVDGGDAIRIAEDPAGARDPAFSPDGTQIAFRSERGGGGIYIAPALGGEARELVPQGRRARFSPDGRWVMYWIGPSRPIDVRDTKLLVRPLLGGMATQIGASCGVDENTPVWSPDGRRILFLAQCGSSVQTAWVSTVDGRDVKSSQFLSAFPIEQWIDDPPRVLIRERAADVTYVTVVPVSADGTKVIGPSQRLTSVTDHVARVSVALDGRMALSVRASGSHIWYLPIDGKGHAAGEPKQLTYGPASDEVGPSLSRDGGKVAFLSAEDNGIRLFYKDLATGREKELSADGRSYANPVFNPDGTGIMCMLFPDPRVAFRNRDSLYYLPLSGSLPKKIWDKSAWSVPWDWAPDGKTLLFYTRDDFSKPLRGAIQQLDLDSLSATRFLDDPELNLWQAHFSHDGRWVTFNSTTTDGKSSRVYVVPFRKALLPRNEWIPITHGDWDDKPRFSDDDKLIFFRSGRSAPFSLRAQKLRSDMRPDGNPVAVYPPGENLLITADDDISVGPHLIVFTQSESTGNIWLLESAKGAK